MNNEELGLVLVTIDEDARKKPYLFECPKYALAEDDKVIVDTEHGLKHAHVVRVLNYILGKDTRIFINMMNENRPLKRVVYAVEVRELEYGE